MSYPIVDQLLVPFTVWFFFVLGILCFAVGVGLIAGHARMHRFFAIMNHSVSMRRRTKWLAIPRDIGPAVQRFRRLIGAACILAGAFSAFVLIAQLDSNRVMAALGVEARYSFVAWIMESVRWFLAAGSLVAIAAGIMLVAFPDALLAIDARANRWYSFRSHSRGAETMNMGFDRWIEGYPRAVGWLIAAAALVVVVDCGIRLFARS